MLHVAHIAFLIKSSTSKIRTEKAWALHRRMLNSVGLVEHLERGCHVNNSVGAGKCIILAYISVHTGLTELRTASRLIIMLPLEQ